MVFKMYYTLPSEPYDDLHGFSLYLSTRNIAKFLLHGAVFSDSTSSVMNSGVCCPCQLSSCQASVGVCGSRVLSVSELACVVFLDTPFCLVCWLTPLVRPLTGCNWRFLLVRYMTIRLLVKCQFYNILCLVFVSGIEAMSCGMRCVSTCNSS
jgi:hypothetical protein